MATVFLTLALVVTHGSPWPWWATRSQLVLLAVSGWIGFVIGDTWAFRSLVILGPGRAAMLMSLAPLFTALIAWPVLHEIPGPLAALGMIMILGGIAWVIWERRDLRHEAAHGSVTVGIVTGVLGAVGQAVGYVISKMAMRTGIDALSATVIRIGAALIGVALVAVVQRDVRRTIATLRDRQAAGFMVAGAFFGPFLGVTLSLRALATIEAGVAASITAFYPVLTSLIAARLHREPLTWGFFAGALVATAGVVVLFLR
jgi:drug/metabolite transporter (DMT)-like permease